MIQITNMNKQKKLFPLGGIIVCIALFLMITVPTASASPSLSVSDYDTNNPDIGKSFDLDIKLRNNGDSCATAVTITPQLTFPFNPDDTLTSDAVDICSGNRETITLPLIVDPSASGGSYPIPLLIVYRDELNIAHSFTNSVTVYVSGNAELNAHITKSNPLKIYPGNTATISVLIENDGTFEAQNINGVLSFDNSLRVMPNQNFAYIGSLKPKQSATADFSIEIPKDAQAQNYPMHLALSYIEDGNAKTKNISLVLNVEKKALFQASNNDRSTLYPNSLGKTVDIKLTNTGTATANQIKIQLQPQFPFTTDGSIKYLNNLSQGESRDVQFVVNVDKSATVGTYALDLVIYFKDDQGNILQDTTTASMTIKKESLSQKIFIDYWYLWIIVPIGLIFILVKLLRKKQEK